MIYLLDGRSHFHHTTGSVGFLSENDRMPPAIVVGIGNISGEQRTRDMTPTPVDEEETASNPNMAAAGGAGDFLRFLTDEVRPWVDARYRTRSFDILIGHSFGGLFITEVLNHDPSTFDAYISISPSLWWNEEAWVAGLDDLFDRHPDAAGSLYMTMGNEGGDMLSGAWTFAGTLEKHAPDDFRWKWTHMPSESHGTVPHRSTYDGLEWTFDGWDPMPLVMAVIRDEKPVEPMLDGLEEHYATLSERFGWEIGPSRELLANVGGYLNGEGRRDEALLAYERNLAWHPEAPESHGELADALAGVCRWDEARHHYGHARDIAEAAGNASLVEFTVERLEALEQLYRTAGACEPR